MLSESYLVDIAPAPVFARLVGLNNRVIGDVEVLGSVLVLGGITTTNVPALQAEAQVYPGIAGRQALFAAVGMRRDILDVVQVCTVWHGRLPNRFLCWFRYESRSGFYPLPGTTDGINARIE